MMLLVEYMPGNDLPLAMIWATSFRGMTTSYDLYSTLHVPTREMLPVKRERIVR